MSATCHALESELVAFLDGQLREEERTPVAAHVASCLDCRREVARLTRVQQMLGDLPRVEPSADFAADFWRRLDGEPRRLPVRRRSLRVLGWAVPALAAAAVLAIVLPRLGTDRTPRTAAVPAPAKVAAAPRVPVAGAPPAKVAHRDETTERVADVDSLRPEDLPPELIEHPELFLRLPVVRRLEKLEYFGSAHDRPTGEDGAG